MIDWTTLGMNLSYLALLVWVPVMLVKRVIALRKTRQERHAAKPVEFWGFPDFVANTPALATCHICGKTFATDEGALTHMRTAHPGSVAAGWHEHEEGL